MRFQSEQCFDYLPKVAMKYTQKSIILFCLPQKLLDIRNAKKQRKADLAKRRTYASQQRMKMITQLVSGRYFNWTLIFMLFKINNNNNFNNNDDKKMFIIH